MKHLLPRLEPIAVLAGAALVAVGVGLYDVRAGLIVAGLAVAGSALDLPRRRA